MTREYTYTDLHNLIDLSAFTPVEAISVLGILFEAGRENADLTLLEKGLSLSKTLNLDNLDALEKSRFHYNVANGWAYRLHQTTNPNEVGYDNENLINEIVNIRLGLSYCNDHDDNFLKSELLVNLGNTFSHLGRCSEAIILWEEALESNPDFGMATGNLGFGVFHYGKAIFDETHKIIFFQFAHNTLKKAIKSNEVYEDAKKDFSNLIESIEKVVGLTNLSCKFNLDDHSLGDTIEEQEYRQWALYNTLFINPLNDIYREPAVAHDCMGLPPMVMKFKEPMIYHDIFNQIKQEYISARYLIYNGLFGNGTHFSDKGNSLVDTLDYSYYSLNVERLKAGFRMCYSVLDKIALFINKYYQINLPPQKVSFSKIWHNHDKQGRVIGLKEQIIKPENWILRGLYWLSRDLFSKELDIVDPEANDIAKIRNFIEHKSFKVVEWGEFGETNDGITLIIEREQFELKCIKVIKLVRAAIMYLAMSVHISEEMKEPDGIVFPYDCIPINDEDKY